MQSVSITTSVVSSNPAHDEVYSIQHYVNKFVSDFRQDSYFLRVLHQLNWPSRVNWNIVESGVNLHKQNKLIKKTNHNINNILHEEHEKVDIFLAILNVLITVLAISEQYSHETVNGVWCFISKQ